jgi:NAD(P)-dependent dehydrogenase (short-subunit alcohol dehydrogenase family)
MGQATRVLLEAEGHAVIGVDLRAAEVRADLSRPDDRAALAAEVRERSGGVVHGVVACAGVGGQDPSRDRREAIARARLIVAVNYFGAVATLVELREQLATAETASAVVVTSIVKPVEADEPLITACLEGDERRALGLVAQQR